MKKLQHNFTLSLTEAAGILVFLLSIVGWLLNLIKIAASDFGEMSGMLVLRCLGVFVGPVGAVMGFL